MAKARTFEQNLKELEGIVEKLEKGNVSLDDSIDLFQKGRALGKTCEKRLKEVEMKVRQLVEDEEGELKTEDLDLGEDVDEEPEAE